MTSTGDQPPAVSVKTEPTPATTTTPPPTTTTPTTTTVKTEVKTEVVKAEPKEESSSDEESSDDEDDSEDDEDKVDDFVYEIAQLERAEAVKRVLGAFKLNPLEILGAASDSTSQQIKEVGGATALVTFVCSLLCCPSVWCDCFW
jgi:hypothetical protein